MNGCPVHGTKFLFTDQSGATYCRASIEKDFWGLTRCYYHVHEKIGRPRSLICSNCGLNPPYKNGSLCSSCRSEREKKKYHEKKILSV